MRGIIRAFINDELSRALGGLPLHLLELLLVHLRRVRPRVTEGGRGVSRMRWRASSARIRGRGGRTLGMKSTTKDMTAMRAMMGFALARRMGSKLVLASK